jgi:alpha-L-rhamnosidase
VVWHGGRFSGSYGVAGAHQDAGYVYLTGVRPGTYSIAAVAKTIPREPK